MKLYDSSMAPNPRRVRIFVAEKGIQIPLEQVDISKADNRKPEFRSKNPMGEVPVLELDDGSYISESVAICRYFEEIHPDPPLMGKDARDRAVVEMWNRRMEICLFMATTGSFRNTHDFFKGRIPQVPEYGRVCKESAFKHLEWLDGELADRDFIAGSHFTIADITALVAIDFGRVTDIRILPEQENLGRWYDTVSARPSAKV